MMSVTQHNSKDLRRPAFKRVRQTGPWFKNLHKLLPLSRAIPQIAEQGRREQQGSLQTQKTELDMGAIQRIPQLYGQAILLC